MEQSDEEYAPPIETRADAWKALLELANGALTTNDPWVASALTVIAFELATIRDHLWSTR